MTSRELERVPSTMDQSVAVGEVGIYADQCRLLAHSVGRGLEPQFPLSTQLHASADEPADIGLGPHRFDDGLLLYQSDSEPSSAAKIVKYSMANKI